MGYVIFFGSSLCVVGGSTARYEVFGVLPFARICLLAARGVTDEPWRMPPSESFHSEICFTLSASSEPASLRLSTVAERRTVKGA